MPLKAQAILHPVRMRIVQALSPGRRRLSVADLVELLGDVPQATVYRQVRELERAELLEVVEHRAVGGTKQALYAIPDLDKLSDRKNFAGASPEQMRVLFQTYAASLVSEFDRSSRRPDFDLEADRALFVQASLYLTPREIDEIRAFVLRILKLRERGPGKGRELRTFAAIGFATADSVPLPSAAELRSARKPRSKGSKKKPS